MPSAAPPVLLAGLKVEPTAGPKADTASNGYFNQPFVAVEAEGEGNPYGDHGLEYIIEMMREVSRQNTPEELVRVYSERMGKMVPVDRLLSLSRRDMPAGTFRITRDSRWGERIDAWREVDRHPVLRGGLLGELIYGNRPVVIDDLAGRFPPDDPALPVYEGQRSLLALPMYDGGEAMNMVILLRERAGAFPPSLVPQQVLTSNLFGRTTNTLVLSENLKEQTEKVKAAYDAIDQELAVVADIQRSLLPKKLPDCHSPHLAAHYETAERAGGDYYDFFPLPDGEMGILVADVSGHGTAAAVIMAVCHSIAHTLADLDPPRRPGTLLAAINRALCARYTGETGTFVTAFYCVYNQAAHRLTWCSAGHNPPRVKPGCGNAPFALTGPIHLPLGIDPDEQYEDAAIDLNPGDLLVLYTDGITEARNPAGEPGDLFGTTRLDAAIDECGLDARQIVDRIVAAVNDFSGHSPPTDDRTLLVAKVL